MPRNILPLLQVLMLVAFLAQSCKPKAAPDTDILAFNLDAGKDYDLEMQWNINQQAGEQQQTVDVTTDYSLKVTGQENDTRTLAVTFNRNRMAMQTMQANVSVDTQEPFVDDSENTVEIPELIARIMYGLKGKSFVMKVNAEGKVTEISGLDSLEQVVVRSMAGVPKEYDEPIRLLFREQFNEQGLRDQFEKAFYIFPARIVKKGDSWVKNFEAGGIKYDNTYTVKSIADSNITIELKSVLSSASPEVDLKGSQNGTYVVDNQTGLLLDAGLLQETRTTSEGSTMTVRNKGTIKGKSK